jgi:alpha-1,2-mannosyltransferase
MTENEGALDRRTVSNRSLAGAPGIRVLVALGPATILRIGTAVFLAAMLVRVGVEYLDIANPTPVGSDAWNYYAAGERLNAGHELYALGPGDRDVPLEPPYWTVPLLSPPAVAVAWRPLALLPENVAMTGWWLTGAALLLGAIAGAVARGSVRVLIGLLLLSPMLAQTVVASNVNSFLVPLLMGTWLAATNGAGRFAGLTVALATVLKLTPAAFVLWFLVRRDREGLVWLGVGTLVLMIVSLLGAGLGPHLEFLDIALDTTMRAASPASLAGTLVDLGLPRELGPSVLLVAGVLGALAIVALRRRPAASFAAAAVTAVVVSPVVYYQTFALFLVALTPWIRGAAGEPRAGSRP